MNNRLFQLGTGLLLTYVTLAIGTSSLVQSGSSVAVAQSPRNFLCTTEGYSAQIRWQGSQPRLTFGSRSNASALDNVPVEELSQRSIVTYTAQQGESKTIVFVYSDGTCAVAVRSASGETTVNELGEIVDQGGTVSSPVSSPSLSPSSPSPVADSSPSPSSPTAADETIVAFQTSRNAVRIFTRNGETLMNVYHKQDQITWLRNTPVKREDTPEGTRYTNTRGESRVEVFLNLNGDRVLVIDGVTEAEN